MVDTMMKMGNQHLTIMIRRDGSLKHLLRRKMKTRKKKCSLHAIQNGILKLDQDCGAPKEGEHWTGETGNPECQTLANHAFSGRVVKADQDPPCPGSFGSDQ